MSDQLIIASVGDRGETLIVEPYKAELKEIVVFVDAAGEATGILEFAGALAQEHGAHLIGVFIQPESPMTPSESFARGTGMQGVIEAHRARVERIEAEHRVLFEEIVRRQRIRSEWRAVSCLSSDVAEHAHYADLAVIARSAPATQVAGTAGFAESLVLTSARPVIMFPPHGTATRVRRIVVGWNAGREAIRAVADALPLLVRAEAVELLVVDPQRHPGHGQEPGADIARHLARHGTTVEVLRLSSGGEGVGHVLLSRAADFGADLLVMGAYGHSHLREWMFGGVTRTVLREAGIPVLMSR